MTKPTKKLTGVQEAALRSKEPTHGTPLHKLPESKRATYRKIAPGEPMYEMVAANKAAGKSVCDSYDHNDTGGCSNPDCFKHVKRRAVSWGLSAERIKARKPYCADPDVHGAECVCLTVPRDRKRRGAAERIEGAKDRTIAAATQQPKPARSIPTLVDLMATCPGIDTTEQTTGKTYRQLLQMLRECM